MNENVLSALSEGTVQGVILTLDYQFKQSGVSISRDMFSKAVETILKSNGWKQSSIDYWLDFYDLKRS